jgi:hypothetical protein
MNARGAEKRSDAEKGKSNFRAFSAMSVLTLFWHGLKRPFLYREAACFKTAACVSGGSPSSRILSGGTPHSHFSPVILGSVFFSF